ncbi:MAG TPA: biotin carboxylase N-terminal domain-containing protein [Candidatus Limnocylindria bacterium]|nr:biotin carboxylase N-terminal domain-containing protein [Candidatus Limnocylindria bacterium]
MSFRTDSPVPSAQPFRRLLVANRGEIAIRVIRACRELGISPIAVHSDADVDALHVRAADRSECIGPAPATESYLSIPSVIEAAQRSGAEAVHPGYGFLSENPEFARAVEAAGLVFVGPPAAALEALGNKVAARRTAEEVGVPVAPGATLGEDDDVAAVERLGFPVMLKAAAGGGGRGMRRVDEAGQLGEAIATARREAQAAFGNGTIYAERLISPARHVEVQLLGDRDGNLAVLGERDCSIQRRHQKLVEESPSPAVDDATRAALFESARRVAVTVDFHNAATVEFLLDADGHHYFLEMNTRLQVEHGVTELVTGLDLVAWQIRVAAGEALPAQVLNPPRHGHAIEVRLYAEDPYDGFRPTAGRVGAWRMPEGPGVRVDAGTEADTDLRPEYDPLLAKLMVHAADRPAAIARLRRALDETLIGGLQTDAGFLRWLVDEPGFAAGDYDTSLVTERWGNGPALTAEEQALVALTAREARVAGPAARAPQARPEEPASAWGRLARREALRR